MRELQLNEVNEVSGAGILGDLGASFGQLIGKQVDSVFGNIFGTTTDFAGSVGGLFQGLITMTIEGDREGGKEMLSSATSSFMAGITDVLNSIFKIA